VKSLSKEILEKVKPIAVFSGDDHDQCSIEHMVTGQPIPEHTVGTFSWAMGNRYPSFGMVSLRAANNTDTTATTLAYDVCFLPAQIIIYICYASLAVLTIILLPLHLWLTSRNRTDYTLPAIVASKSVAISTLKSLALVASVGLGFYMCCIAISLA
jgi:hypothetical protein